MIDSTETVRVVIADDSLLVREGVSKVLAADGCTVVAEACDATELLRMVALHRPDVAVVDIRMPPGSSDEGLRAADQIGVLHPQVSVLILSDYLEPEYATRLLQAGTPGRGYLLKETVTDRGAFAGAIRRVAAGETVMDTAIVRNVFNRVRTDDPLAALTEREHSILAQMAEGLTNRAIAKRLFLSERTVEGHIGSTFHKLSLANTPDDHRRVLAVLAYLGEKQ